MLNSSLADDHPYDVRIALAPPLDMSLITSRIPEHGGLLALYVYNLYRSIKAPAFRDMIVRRYQHFWPSKFRKNPRLISLRLRDIKSFNRLRSESPKLVDFINEVRYPSYLVYAGKDSRLGLQGKSKLAFENLEQLANDDRIQISIIDGLTHRFNIGKEKRLLFSYNNDLVIERIRWILEKSLGSLSSVYNYSRSLVLTQSATGVDLLLHIEGKHRIKTGTSHCYERR